MKIKDLVGSLDNDSLLDLFQCIKVELEERDIYKAEYGLYTKLYVNIKTLKIVKAISKRNAKNILKCKIEEIRNVKSLLKEIF